MLDREATSADLDHLRAFAKSRETGVEFYVEPETTATDTTVVAIAFDGEWTRRRVGTPKAAEKLARSCKVADLRRHRSPATRSEMRAWNARAKADRDALEGWPASRRTATGDPP